MKNILHITAKVLLTLLIALPVVGTLGLMPAPTRDLYNTDLAFNFIEILGQTGYVMWIMALVNLVVIVALWAKREALAAALLLPITVNIFAFHLFIDGGVFTAGAIMGNVLFLLNIYFLWANKDRYKLLFEAKR